MLRDTFQLRGAVDEIGYVRTEAALEFLVGVMMLQTVKATDRLKALEMAAKYGGVAELALTVEEQPEDEMTPERRLALWEAIKRIKSVEEFETMLVNAAKEQSAADGG